MLGRSRMHGNNAARVRSPALIRGLRAAAARGGRRQRSEWEAEKAEKDGTQAPSN